jgi:hypothetical protein
MSGVFAVAFLSVIPSGNLLLPLSLLLLVFAVAFLSVIPSGNLLLAHLQ